MSELEFYYNDIERHIPQIRMLNVEKEKLMYDLDNIVL
jgi:hypothetical protein